MPVSCPSRREPHFRTAAIRGHGEPLQSAASCRSGSPPILPDAVLVGGGCSPMQSPTRRIGTRAECCKSPRTPVRRGAELLSGAVPIAQARPDAVSKWSATLSGVDRRYSSTCNNGSQALGTQARVNRSSSARLGRHLLPAHPLDECHGVREVAVVPGRRPVEDLSLPRRTPLRKEASRVPSSSGDDHDNRPCARNGEPRLL